MSTPVDQADSSYPRKIAIIGCGTWGIALACMFANHGCRVEVWSESPTTASLINKTKSFNNLPKAEMPKQVRVLCDMDEVCSQAELVVVSVASVWLRTTAQSLSRSLSLDQIVVVATKGIECATLMTMSEVVSDEFVKCGLKTSNPVVALSGPTHAEEVCMGMPSAIVAACANTATALRVQTVCSNELFRVYTSSDPKGVELCGAIKNVIALASGIAAGLGCGDNARAALITRGMNEIARLGSALGCSRETFSGLAGIGDLVVTATSQHSRNYRAGMLLAKGLTGEQAQAEIGQVVEALNVIPAVEKLIKITDVEMPIVNTVIAILDGTISVKSAASNLMCRPLKAESISLPVRRVITYGTFDLLHYGHINLLRRAKQLGNYLIVALSTDEFNWNEKEKKCYSSYEQRKAILESIEYVDLVIPECSWDQKRTDIKEYNADVFVIGDDWEGKFDFLREEGCEVVYLPRTPDISTSQIKEDLSACAYVQKSKD